MSAATVVLSGFRVGRRDLAAFWPNVRVWIFAWLLRVTTGATMWILMGRLLESEELLRFLLVGQATMVGPAAAGFTVAASAWDRMDGTYAQIVATPSSLAPYFIGRTSVWLGNALASSTLTFAVLVPLFRIPLPLMAIPWLLLALVITNAAAYAFYLFLGCFVVRAPRLRNMIHNLATITITAIAGIVVPVTFWPGAIQAFAQILPVTHGVAAIRHLFDGTGILSALQLLSVELLVGLTWLAAAVLLIDRMAESGRRDGSIETSLG